MFETFINILKEKLSQELPGQDAQYQMVSPQRFRVSLSDMDSLNAKLAAVLILFYEKDKQPHLVFMQRNTYPGVHSNQISFPGGKYEPYDEDMTTTALRESHEELGINSNEVSVIGTLTKVYIPPSNFIVEPVVGISQRRPHFIPDRIEVSEVIEIPFQQFLSTNSKKTVQVQSQGNHHHVPAYVINGTTIWGATAMILSELSYMMRDEIAILRT